MEPSARSYNTNGSGRAARAVSQPDNRSKAATPLKPIATAKRARRSRVLAEQHIVERQGEAPTVGEPLSVAVESPQQEVEHEAAAGPVVGLADFEDIFIRFQTPLTNFVYRLVGNREQALDLTQDVFVKAYRALASGTTIQAAALSSWLYRIASNTATDALRRRRLINWLPLSLFNEDRGVGAGMPGAESGSQQPPSEEALAAAAGIYAGGYDGGRFEQRVA